MADRAPAWVVPVMRAGYAARGVVYVLVGFLALRAAWRGGQAEGAQGALATLTDEAWGTAVLWAIAIGLFCYAAWRLIDAWLDLDRHGAEAKGIVARMALVVTGVVHAMLGIYAIHLATAGRGAGGGEGEGQERWTAWLLSQPFGRWIVIAIGAAVIGAGIYYAYKGIAEKYKERLRYTRTVERLDPACKLGLVAQGAVVGMIGVFLLWAGWTSDPSEAGGLAQAFEAVRQAAFGRVLLGLLALGMIGFAIECFIEAAYRVVPARAGSDVATLASRARAGLARAEAEARTRLS
jgi:Domain of Unknown Function (DUF1206)